MRRWVEYTNGRVDLIDKKRLLKRATNFKKICEEFKDGCGVSAVTRHYKPYVDMALRGEINSPILDELPYTGEMHNRELPDAVEDALIYFKIALESRPAVYGVLEPDVLLNYREEYIKEETMRVKKSEKNLKRFKLQGKFSISIFNIFSYSYFFCLKFHL